MPENDVKSILRTESFEPDMLDKGPANEEYWDIALSALYRIRRNYELSAPNELCEYKRLELAHQSIRCFWNIFRWYMPWIPHFIIGRYMLNEYDELADFVLSKMDTERPDYDYVMEEVGACFGMNHYREPIEPLASEVQEFLEQNEAIYPTDTMRRRLFVDMCMTTCADAWWAKDVQDAMQQIEEGESVDWLTPGRGSHGRPSQLKSAKFRAVQKVVFANGQGIRKLDARMDVAEAVGVSVATLRHWEAQLNHDENTEFWLWCTHLAGVYETELSARPRTEEQREMLDAIEPASFKFQDTVYMAGVFLREVNETSLDQIRDMLRDGRDR